jgi:hypothetical protein
MCRPRTAGKLAAICAALVGLVSGCALPREVGTRTAGWYDRVRGGTGNPAGTPGLYLQTAVLDRTAPDPFLSQELWAAAAASNPLSAEQSALLEVNGFRARVVGGIPPARLVSLLSSPDALDPMARTVRAGEPKVVPVNGPTEAARFAVRADLKGDPAPVELADVECGLAVTARPADNGRVTLQCVPEVQHGDRQQFLKPTADGAFDRREQKPRDGYPTLGFEVTLGPGEYLVVGPTADPAGTLGGAFFVAAAGDRVRQRVLVVRAGTAGPGSAEAGPTGRPTTAAAAAQAAVRPTARGVAVR